MNELIRHIESVRAKLEGWKRHGLKETQTRVTVIDPTMETLGWDVRDPDEVQLEYPTVDNKSVDYALKINGKPVLLVEAKPLDDQLNDVKAITQVVGYAANDGIDWCVLTNGIVWRVYKSSEKCAAPDKLMFEVSLDPRQTEGIPGRQLAEQLWRLSREEMAKGTLDVIGEQTFTDGKVRKALETVFRNPPRAIVNAIREEVSDDTLTPLKIRESVMRIWSTLDATLAQSIKLESDLAVMATEAPDRKSSKRMRKKRGTGVDESVHVSGKPKEVMTLYTELDRYCLSLSPTTLKISQKRYINYLHAGKTFCSVVILRGGLRVYLKLKYNRLSRPLAFARDVSGVGHWGVGDVELAISNLSQLEQAKSDIKRSLDAVS